MQHPKAQIGSPSASTSLSSTRTKRKKPYHIRIAESDPIPVIEVNSFFAAAIEPPFGHGSQ
jgi:hypothetical protein